jgi:hypothetical protein
MTRLRRKLTYANVMATIAVFIALGGVGYAAVKLPKNSVGTKQIKNNAITGAKIKDGTVTGEKIASASLGTVPSATTAKSAESAKTAESAKSATSAISANTATTAKTAESAATAAQAGNAASLGGVPASAYTRSGCGALTGQIKGFARIDDPTVSTTGFSTAGVEVPYNCSGGEVLAWRFSEGKYEVKFVESPVGFAFATPMEDSGQSFFPVNDASVNRTGAGEFEVQIWNEVTNDFANGSFTILTP